MSSPHPLRGAVVGCGMIAEFHLRGWRRIPGVEIVALVDPDLSAAERYRANFAPAARLYASLEAMLAVEALDFVDLLTPPALHPAQCRQVLAAGLPLICQKPLCAELAAARALVAAFSGSPKLFCVHENHIYRPWFQEVRARRRDGSLGPLRLVRLAQHDREIPPQSFKRESPRGVLLEYGVHLADMIRTLLGPPTRVTARLSHDEPRLSGESAAHVTFDYPAATAVIDISWGRKTGGIDEALFRSENGEAVYTGTMTRGGDARFRVTKNQQILRDEIRHTVDDYTESFHLLQRDFVEAIRSGTRGPQPAVENLRTLEMIFAAYESAARGMPVTFAEFAATGRP